MHLVCVPLQVCTYSWHPCGLFLLYRGCVAPCFPVFPVLQLWFEQCCCLIDWALCLPCSVTDSKAQSFGGNVISTQAALHQGLRTLAACFNILTQLTQLMNSIRDPWASAYKPMDKHTHMHPKKLFLLFPAHTTSVCSGSWLLPFLSKWSAIPCIFSS